MTFEQIQKADLADLLERMEKVESKLFYISMADFIRGQEKIEWDELHREKLWLIQRIREIREAREERNKRG